MTIYTPWDYTGCCKHGNDIYYCNECERERELKMRQEAHQASVRKQQAKLKLAKWRVRGEGEPHGD